MSIFVMGKGLLECRVCSCTAPTKESTSVSNAQSGKLILRPSLPLSVEIYSYGWLQTARLILLLLLHPQPPSPTDPKKERWHREGRN